MSASSPGLSSPEFCSGADLETWSSVLPKLSACLRAAPAAGLRALLGDLPAVEAAGGRDLVLHVLDLGSQAAAASGLGMSDPIKSTK